MAQYSLGRSDTTEDVTGTFGRAEAGPDEGLALVVAWCRDEPERVGEVVVVAPGDGRAFVVGRGDEPPMDFEHVRAGLVRQRPGRNAVTAPLGARRLSREQLHVRRLDAERLAVENHGKRAMWVRGAETSHAVVGVGEAVVVEGQLVLYCARRPAALAGLLHLDDAALHAFGEPDEHGIVGESPVVWALRDAIACVAQGEGHVLVCGPTGAGKELAARAVHAASARAAGPFVARDVAAIPHEVLAAELFGEEGAEGEAARGLVGEADGGTLLLDDVGPVAEQVLVTLGRFMDAGAYYRVGEARARHADVRVVATLDADPAVLPVGFLARFRHVLRVPGLAERVEDVPMLAAHLLRVGLPEHADVAARFLDEAGRARVAPELVERLLAGPFDGGVRALDARLWQAVVASPGSWVTAPVLRAVEAPAGREEAPRAAAEAAAREAEEVGIPAGTPKSVVEGLPTLTRAERIVLQHLALNQTSRQIGRRLFVSVRTVQNHRARICDKLGLRGNNALLGVALELARYLGPPEEGMDR